MNQTPQTVKDHIKTILIWGLPGLYVAIALAIATWMLSNIRFL